MFELYWPSGLLLNNQRPLTDTTTAYQLADPHLDQIAAAQLAVDCQVEQRTIAKATLLLKPEPNSSDLLRVERPLRSQLATRVPSGAAILTRIVHAVSHRHSPLAISGHGENPKEPAGTAHSLGVKLIVRLEGLANLQASALKLDLN